MTSIPNKYKFLTLDDAKEGTSYIFPYLPVFAFSSDMGIIDYIDSAIKKATPGATPYCLKKFVSNDLIDLNPSATDVANVVWAVHVSELAPLQQWVLRQRWLVPESAIRIRTVTWPSVCTFDMDFGKATMLVDEATILPGNAFVFRDSFGRTIGFSDGVDGLHVTVSEGTNGRIR